MSVAQPRILTVYTSSSCQPCKQLKRFLDKEGILYREVSVEVPEKAQELKSLGYRQVPLTLIPGEPQRAVEGFQPQLIKKAFLEG